MSVRPHERGQPGPWAQSPHGAIQSPTRKVAHVSNTLKPTAMTGSVLPGREDANLVFHVTDEHASLPEPGARLHRRHESQTLPKTALVRDENARGKAAREHLGSPSPGAQRNLVLRSFFGTPASVLTGPHIEHCSQ